MLQDEFAKKRKDTKNQHNFFFYIAVVNSVLEEYTFLNSGLDGTPSSCYNLDLPEHYCSTFSILLSCSLM